MSKLILCAFLLIESFAFKDVDWKITKKLSMDIDTSASYQGQKMIVLDSIASKSGSAIYSSLFSTNLNAIMTTDIRDIKNPMFYVKKISKYLKSYQCITSDSSYIVTTGVEFINISSINSNSTTEVSYYTINGFNREDKRCIYESFKRGFIYIIENTSFIYAHYKKTATGMQLDIVSNITIPFNYSLFCKSIKINEARNTIILMERYGSTYYLQEADMNTMKNKSVKMWSTFEIYADSGEFYKIIKDGTAILLSGQKTIYFIDLLKPTLALNDLNISTNLFLPIRSDSFIIGKNTDSYEFMIAAINDPLNPVVLFQEEIDENFYSYSMYETSEYGYIVLVGSQKISLYQIDMIDYRDSIESMKILIIIALILLMIALSFAAYVCIMRFKRERDERRGSSIIAKVKPREKSQETMLTEDTIDVMAADSWRLAIICPISKRIMKDPVFLSDGYTYEREVIEDWLRTNNCSPTTNAPLSSKDVWPNVVLSNFINKNVLTQIHI